MRDLATRKLKDCMVLVENGPPKQSNDSRWAIKQVCYYCVWRRSDWLWTIYFQWLKPSTSPSLTWYLAEEGKGIHFFMIDWKLHEKTEAKVCSGLCRDKQCWNIPRIGLATQIPSHINGIKMLNSLFTVSANFISPSRSPCFAIPSLFLFPAEWLLPLQLIHFICFSDCTWHPLPYLRLGFSLILPSLWLSQNMFSMVLRMDLLLNRENEKVMKILYSSN